MIELIFFLEEPSAREMLKGLLNSLINPDITTCKYIVFEGKSDLENNISRKLRSWNNPKARFIILRDKDSGDCREIKNNLKQKCINSGKPDALIRIACHELESWYLGDLHAVEKGLGLSNIAKHQNKRKFRTPDTISNAAEELMKLTNSKYQKILGSRKIGPFLDLENNNSHSFKVFISGLKRVLQQYTETTNVQ